MTMTATEISVGGLPAVLLQMPDPAPLENVTVLIQRSPDGGIPGGVVRGTPKEIWTGGALILIDTEPSLGEPLTYTASVAPVANPESVTFESVSVPALAVAGDGYLLTTPLVGGGAVVAGLEERDHGTRFRGSVLEVAGRSLPVVLSDVRGGDTWKLTALTSSAEERQTLWGVLSGDLLLVRHSDPSANATTGWHALGDVTEDRIDPETSLFTLALVAIDPPESTLEAAILTLAVLHEWIGGDTATLTDYSVAEVTLFDLATGGVDAL